MIRTPVPFREKSVRIVHRRKERADFLDGENDGKPNAGLRPHDTAEPSHVLRQHFPIQKQQRALRLVLRGRRDLQIDGEGDQEALDGVGAQVGRIPLTVETNEPSHPIDVGLLGSQTVALVANPLAYPAEQPVQIALHGDGWV